MTTPERLILAVDCGSTSLKAALYDADLRRLGQAAVPVPYTREGGAEVEMPGEGLWAAFAELAQAACREAGVTPSAVTDVALDSQAQTFALCDSAGRAITPFFSWLDRRAEAEAAEIAATLGTDFHRHCSFSPPIPQLQLAKMLWLQRHHPDLTAGGSQLSLLPGFIARRLGVPNSADRNLAAMGGAYSLVSGTWWNEALSLCGVTAEQMPSLVDIGSTVTATMAPFEAAFRPGLRVTFAGNDQTAGAFGNGCDRGGMVITLGTALVVYRHTGTQSGPYNPGGCWGPYPAGSFYELGTIDQGCQALDWARQRMQPKASAAAVDAFAQRVIAAGRQGQAPLFRPQGIPAGQPWVGSDGDPELASYAVLEGIAFALRRLIEVNLRAGGRARRITAIGGGSRSDVWLGVIADVLATPVCRGSGDALLGAAALALGQRQGPVSGVGRPFIPDPVRRAVLEERYRRWLSLS